MIEAKDKPDWTMDAYYYCARWKIANRLVWLAKKIHPKNPEVYAFWAQIYLDSAITGTGVVKVERIDPIETIIKKENNER